MWARGILGCVACLVGAVWIAQGSGALKGSVMSGRGEWTLIGAVLLVVGAALLAWAWRIRRRQPGGAA